MTTPRPDHDCPCNTEAGSTTIDTFLDDVIKVDACDTWGIWIGIEKQEGGYLSAPLSHDDAVAVRDALTEALNALPGSAVTP